MSKLDEMRERAIAEGRLPERDRSPEDSLPPLDLGRDSVDEDINSAEDIYVPEDLQLVDTSEVASRRLKSDYQEPPESKSDKAKSTPPLVGEWQDFFSRIVIKSMTDYYIGMAFRGIDEDLLSDHEVERIRMTQEERDRIAKPFAEFANKVRWMRKHGRMIISGGGISDSIIAMGMWVSRVNRIARKYRNKTVKGNVNVRTGQGEPAQGNGQYVFPPGGYPSTGG